MDSPRKTKLYNQIAKDYTPKQAEMLICKYIEDLEAQCLEHLGVLAETVKFLKAENEKLNERIDYLIEKVTFPELTEKPGKPGAGRGAKKPIESCESEPSGVVDEISE